MDMVLLEIFQDGSRCFHTAHSENDDIEWLLRMLFDAPNRMMSYHLRIFVTRRNEECIDIYAVAFEIEARTLCDGLRTINVNMRITPPQF